MDEDTVTEIDVSYISSGLLWISACKAKWSSNIEIMALQNTVAQLVANTTTEHVAGLGATALPSKTAAGTSSDSGFDL